MPDPNRAGAAAFVSAAATEGRCDSIERDAPNGLGGLRVDSRRCGLEPLGRTLILAGLLLAGLGLFLSFGPPLPLLGKLPGDIRIERPGFRFYFPITTCLLLSGGLTGVFWLVSKLR